MRKRGARLSLLRMRSTCVRTCTAVVRVCTGGEVAMPTARKKTALLNGLDQYSAYYSVICVFGSVVGCVVVPLITQVTQRTQF